MSNVGKRRRTRLDSIVLGSLHQWMTCVLAINFVACASPQVLVRDEPQSIDFAAFSREQQARILTAHHVQNQDGELRQVHEGVRLLRDFRRVLGERMMSGHNQRESLKILANVLCKRVGEYAFPLEQQFHLDIPAGRYPVDRLHYSVVDEHIRVQVPPVRLNLGLPEWEASAFDLTGNEPQEIVSRLDFVTSPHYAQIVTEIVHVFAGAHLLASEWEPIIAHAESIHKPVMVVHDGGRITFTLGACDDTTAADGWRGRSLRCTLVPVATQFANMRLQEATIARLNDERVDPSQSEPTPDAREVALPLQHNRTDVPDVRTW